MRRREMYSKSSSEQYTKLNYLQATGTQYIDTGIVCNLNNTFEITCSFDNIVTSGMYHGAITSSVIRCHTGIVKYYNKPAHQFEINNVLQGDADTEIHTFIVNPEDNMYITFWLFYRNSDGVSRSQTYVIGKIYGLKVYSESQIIHNLVPVKRNSDGECGMYDLVSGAFFTNAGTGNFTGG